MGDTTISSQEPELTEDTDYYSPLYKTSSEVGQQVNLVSDRIADNVATTIDKVSVTETAEIPNIPEEVIVVEKLEEEPVDNIGYYEPLYKLPAENYTSAEIYVDEQAVTEVIGEVDVPLQVDDKFIETFDEVKPVQEIKIEHSAEIDIPILPDEGVEDLDDQKIEAEHIYVEQETAPDDATTITSQEPEDTDYYASLYKTFSEVEQQVNLVSDTMADNVVTKIDEDSENETAEISKIPEDVFVVEKLEEEPDDNIRYYEPLYKLPAETDTSDNIGLYERLYKSPTDTDVEIFEDAQIVSVTEIIEDVDVPSQVIVDDTFDEVKPVQVIKVEESTETVIPVLPDN